MHISNRPNRTTRATLLVVDDQPLNIRVLYEAFVSDYRVLMATGGEQALHLCKQHLPDLVLLDVVMPGMDGHQVCRALKADPLTRDIPVVFVTAQDDAEHEALGLDLGAVDFILKPVNPAVVRARVKTHLGFARATALLNTTLDAAAEGILVTNLADNVSHANEAFARLWNLPPGIIDRAHSTTELVSWMLAQTLHPERHDDLLSASPCPTRGDDGFIAIELKLDRHFERRVRPFQINAVPGGHVFSFRDVTEHRRASAQLAQLNDTLESRISDRTRELELATRVADAANQAKTEFLSNMSHEIRTPINGVIGMAHLGLRGSPQPAQRDCLQKILGAGEHLLGVVNDILDYAKIEAGKLVCESTLLTIQQVFADVEGQMAGSAEAKGLGLHFHVDPDLADPLMGDPLRLRQILLNYVSNAIKFSTRGNLTVNALRQPCVGDGCCVRFEVNDQGVGLSKEQVGILFQSFQQTDASTTRCHGGTGLGLAISKRLANLMGGEVGVTSQPGSGSTFWFTAILEAGAANHEGRADGEVTDRFALDWQLALGGLRILLAEDNLLNQEVAAGLLADVGAIVQLADDGLQALRLVELGEFDCVLMDVQMPRMDGLQATRAIRSMPGKIDLPIIAMTANSRIEDRQRCDQAGMNDFISKPFVPEALFAIVAKWSLRVPEPALAAASPQSPVPSPVAEISANSEAIDLNILSRAVGGNAEKVRRYATLFDEAIPEVLGELEATLANGDLAGLAQLAHRLKASSRMVGALGFAAMCRTLEDLGAEGTLDEAADIVRAMPAMLTRVSAGIGRAFP